MIKKIILSIGCLTSSLIAITNIANNLYKVEAPCGDGSVSGITVNIYNKTSHVVKYWYTDWCQNGLPRWYVHNVDAQSVTYDWLWANNKHSHALEIYNEQDSKWHTGYYTTFIWNGQNAGQGYVREYTTVQQWPDYANPKFDYQTWTLKHVDWYLGLFNTPEFDYIINK